MCQYHPEWRNLEDSDAVCRIYNFYHQLTSLLYTSLSKKMNVHSYKYNFVKNKQKEQLENDLKNFCTTLETGAL